MATFVEYQPKFRNLAMNGFAVLANKRAEEDANASQFKAACCVQPCANVVRTVRVSWLERGSSANEVIVFSTCFTRQCKWTDLIGYVDTIMPNQCDLITIAAVADNRQRCLDFRGIFYAKNLRGPLYLRKVHVLILKTQILIVRITKVWPNCGFNINPKAANCLNGSARPNWRIMLVWKITNDVDNNKKTFEP